MAPTSDPGSKPESSIERLDAEAGVTWRAEYSARVRERARLLEHEDRITPAMESFRRTFPPLHRANLTASNLSQWGDLVGKARAVVESDGLLALVAGRGRGKTQLATLLAYEAVGRYVVPEYAPMADIQARFKAKVYNGDASEEEFLNRLGRVGFLVLDELQDVAESEHTARIFTRLMDKRYANMKPTILIANLRVEAFVEHIGKSAASRISERGMILDMSAAPNFRAGGGR